MQIAEGLEGIRATPAGGVVTVGNFDGVHRGHQSILAKARGYRRQVGGPLTVVTFEPHPLTVLAPEKAPPRLTPPAIKQELLRAAGAERLVVLPPTPDVLNLSAEEFWALLRDHAKPRHIVEGTNFTFGKNRGGTVDRLRGWAAESGVQLHVADAISVTLTDLAIAPVSSSMIRWLLGHGRVRDAAIGLGRPYVLAGPVVKGYQRGRTIGMPTANLDMGDQLVPLEGVYAGRCEVDGAVYPAAVSIGRMETFGAGLKFQVEAHLIGFAGDLYGRELRVELLDWIRGQLKFGGLEPLMERMARDLAITRERVGMTPERELAKG